MKKRVIVAMSGGVDSSVSIYLLQKAGYEVCGITLRLSAESEHVNAASKIAAKLNIEHRILDIQQKFKAEIIDYFAQEYLLGHTPNPCLRCNHLIKFGKLMDIAVKEDAYFATGHYSRIDYDPVKDIYMIKKAKDAKKDQSYVLFMLDQLKLSRLLLPLADKTKQEIKLIAQQLDLGLDLSKESQDICFIPDKDYVSYIKNYLVDFSTQPGEIINSQGKVIGRHKGIIFYTIGQRKGLGIAHPEPLFVTRINRKENTIIVGTESELYNQGCVLNNTYFSHPDFKQPNFKAKVKIRYHHEPAQAQISQQSNNSYQLEFLQPQKSITIGQGAVFYDQEDRVIGGGIISKIIY
ncbi:MAG: tRNA 2-thiouridine(34) synthase MnmA [Candidatus Omnitrophica bacterium]|nr:tRNA 2-thiouridine(34) synthase MnmA [Candidatus Omnitrophota bacterium]